MKIIPILFILLWSCNSEEARPVEVAETVSFDSLMVNADSANQELRDFKVSLAQTVSQIKELNSRKGEVFNKISSNPVYMDALTFDRVIDTGDYNELRNKLREYETEIARLKKKIYTDSVYHSKVDRVPNSVTYEPEKPNDKSLIIELDRKLRGDGDISEQGVSVWIMKYTKKAKKLFKGYDNCQSKDLNLLDAKEASYYRGQYFFNDIEPGEYLIKVCALYGNWMVINKRDYKQEIEMLMSPPIQ